jgi:hypothetical protein
LPVALVAAPAATVPPAPEATPSARVAQSSPPERRNPHAPFRRFVPLPRPQAPVERITEASLMGQYRDAVCACQSKACVSELQSGFIRQLDRVDYDPHRDDPDYNEALREATRCVAALP